MHCPDCKSNESLYRSCDARYSPELNDWELGQMGDTVDCTNCDWSGYVDDLEMAGDAK